MENDSYVVCGKKQVLQVYGIWLFLLIGLKTQESYY